MATTRSGDGFVRCSDGHVRWGLFGAAGVVFVTVDGGGAPLVMLQLRSAFSHEGGHVVVPGRRARPRRDAARGCPARGRPRRSASPPPSPALLGEYVFAPAVDWSYTTVVVQVDEPFGEPLNFETEAIEWMPVDEVDRRSLHPGFASAWPHLRPIVSSAGAR